MSKTKLLAALVVVGTLAIGVGSNALSTADAQGVPGTGAAPAAGPSRPGGGGDGPAGRRRPRAQGRAR